MAESVVPERARVRRSGDIGDGLRKVRQPISTVAYLSVETSNGMQRGTGFLVEIYGQYIVISSAHILYDAKRKRVAEEVNVFFGRESKRQKTPSFVGNSIYVADEYKDENDLEHNFGFVFIGKREDFEDKDGFGLVRLSEKKINCMDGLVLTGYPTEVPGSQQYCQYSADLNDIQCNPKRRLLTYKASMPAGMEGAPIYFSSNAGFLVTGIHVSVNCEAVWLTCDKIMSIWKTVLKVANGEEVTWQFSKK